MNERIQELKKQAFDFVAKQNMCKKEYFWENIRHNRELQDSVDAKFAELIVRECIERVRDQYIPIRDQTVEGKLNPLHTQLRLRTERETDVIECGVNSVISLEELIQEQTDKWYKENILGVEE